MNNYQRADFQPLRETIYGMGLHWTTWTWPQSGQPLPFPEAVERFDVKAFVETARDCGAGHVLLTVTHADHWLPGPNPEVDRILPGRTCRRDLIMEIADALAPHGIRLMLYYNHGVYFGGGKPDAGQDPEWQKGVGSWESGLAKSEGRAVIPDRRRYYDNYCRVVSWMGAHYGSKVIAFWFDSGYEHIRFPDTPWDRFTAAAKAGNPGRLVTYNSGVDNLTSYTPFQDYWAGELAGLAFRPQGALTPTGLPWYAYCAWYPYRWGIDKDNKDQPLPPVDPQDAVALLESFRKCGGAVTFNVLYYQEGAIHPNDLATLRAVRRAVRK